MFKFKASDLPEILTRWSARYSVFVPSGSPDNAQMRIWSRRTRKEVRFMEPDEYTNLIVAPKGFVFGEREELFRWEGNEKTCTAISAPSSSSLQEEDKILFGLRPCDTYGLAYMDRFFLGEHHDINYHLRRQHVSSVRRNVFSASSCNAFLRLRPVNSRSRYRSGATCDRSALPRSDPASTQYQSFSPFSPFLWSGP